MEKVKQSRIKKYFSDIVAAVGILMMVFSYVFIHNDLIFAFGCGLSWGAIAGTINVIWTLRRHTQELKNMLVEMKKAVESE